MLIVISSLSQFHFVNFHFCTIYYLYMLYFLPMWLIKSLITESVLFNTQAIYNVELPVELNNDESVMKRFT